MLPKRAGRSSTSACKRDAAWVTYLCTVDFHETFHKEGFPASLASILPGMEVLDLGQRNSIEACLLVDWLKIAAKHCWRLYRPGGGYSDVHS
ncbi:hypothetical protein WJX84_008566 [Apatococcus fuscideae]|uniref:Uncharacterized protein n=1 Tax=Apatococcus fuscideae TaxID=2026836 RepID=A0AAW1T3D5_9CHLO